MKGSSRIFLWVSSSFFDNSAEKVFLEFQKSSSGCLLALWVKFLTRFSSFVLNRKLREFAPNYSAKINNKKLEAENRMCEKKVSRKRSESIFSFDLVYISKQATETFRLKLV